jgi:Flp pilus assembly protein TadD
MPFRPLPSLLVALAAGLSLSAGAVPAQEVKPRPRPDAAALAQSAESPYGTYLAARLADDSHDYATAASLSARALALDPTNRTVLEIAVTSRLALGDVAGAAEAARGLIAQGVRDQSALLALVAADADRGDFAAVKADLSGGQSLGEMTDALLLAWADLGEGSMADALAGFDALSSTAGMQAMAMYHKALAMALSGDFEGADKLLSDPALVRIRQDRRALTARLEVLAQLDRRAEALDALNRAFPPGADAGMDALRARLQGTDPITFDVVTSPRDGAVEVLYNMATALIGQADDAYVLSYARTAAALRPDHVEAVMLSARLLQRLDQQQLAAEVYALIPESSPAHIAAQIGRADAIQQAGDPDQAVAILGALAASHPQDRDLAHALADVLRRQGKFAEAVQQYDKAIALVPTPQPSDWSLFYARAIALSEAGRWPEAEADFKRALALNPGQPQVLNYLGYSYVDRGENLDEALKMIQQAVLAAPDQGYIVDSLAWAYYRLGRFKEAVAPMERASLLMPVDPVVTDHLGDVYWMVGRRMEAKFQWRRALSFNPSEKDAQRIRRKLEVGLDQVLDEEKAGTLPPASDTPLPDAPATAPEAVSPGGNGG